MAVGTQIGSYQIERQLGRGGFGVVYVGIDVRLGRRAAIKQLLPELSGNREVVERFFNEAKAAANISHAGIVEIYDVGWHTDGSAYFAMKLLEGDSLGKRLRDSQNAMPIARACTIARQVASALVAAHARGIVHRDLKPDNIILVPDEEVPIGERATVLDFGIAKLCGDDGIAHKTRTGMLMGTPAYMSPEQCRGAGEVDHRTDVYALGCILFELLTGRAPFIGDGPGEVMGMHQFVEPPAVRSLRPDVPAELEALVGHALAKKPAQRIQQMTELAAALRPFTGDVRPSGERPAGASEPGPPALVPAAVGPPSTMSVAQGEAIGEAKRRSKLPLVLGGGVLAAVIVAIVLAARSSTPAAARDAGTAGIAADAEADAASIVELDAAIIATSAEPLRQDCATAQAERAWARLQDCARELAKVDPAAGKALLDRGVSEAVAERDLRTLGDELQADQLAAARVTLAKIAATSVYRQDAEARFKSGSEKQAIDSVVAELRLLTKDCARHEKRLQGAATSHGRSIADAARARVPCKGAVASSDYSALVKQGDATAETNCANAMALYRQALELKPSGIEAHVGIGYCHLDAKEFASAHRRFTVALGVSPRHEPALRGLAETYGTQGRKDEAIAAWKRYLEAFPGAARGKRALELLCGDSCE